MARASLRRYDVQAVYALVLAVASMAPGLMAVALFVRNFNSDLGAITYGEGSNWLPMYLGAIAVSGLLSAAGLALGWNSAGQRRNQRPTWSWVGFFAGGLVLTLNVVLCLAFVMLRVVIPR